MTDYRKFFETAHDLMCVVSKTHFVEVNPAFTRILGYSPTELISRPFLEFVHPEDVGMTTAMTRLAAFPADGAFKEFSFPFVDSLVAGDRVFVCPAIGTNIDTVTLEIF